MGFYNFIILFFCLFCLFLNLGKCFTEVLECIHKNVIWITAIDSPEKGISHEYFKFVSAAIHSALENAPSLIPFLIVSCSMPPKLPFFLTNNTRVHILCHNLTFEKSLREHGINLLGPYYRLDIPNFIDRILLTIKSDFVDTNHVLYTDTDVLFFNDFTSCSLPSPKVLYLGPQQYKQTMTNSGVLYMNILAMKKHFSNLLAYAQQKQWQFLSYDQGLMINYFVKQTSSAQLLPDIFNWKGYWGGNPNEVIIAHFHGPKPGRCLDCFLTFRFNTSVCLKIYRGCGIYTPYFQLIPDYGYFYELMLRQFTIYSYGR